VAAADVPLEDGSLREHLWGANDDPGRGPDDRIEHASLIDIRPAHGNRSQQVLMIANETLRTSRRMGQDDAQAGRLGCERVLNLTDRAAVATDRRSFRREWRRWRGVAA